MRLARISNNGPTLPMLIDPWEFDRYRPGDTVLLDSGFDLGLVRPVRTPGDYVYSSWLWLRWKLWHQHR